MAQRTERDAHVRIVLLGHGRIVPAQAGEGGARQRLGESCGRCNAHELRRRDLAAQRVRPAQVADAGDQPAGCQVMAPDVAQVDRAVGDGVAQLARDVQPRE